MNTVSENDTELPNICSSNIYTSSLCPEVVRHYRRGVAINPVQRRGLLNALPCLCVRPAPRGDCNFASLSSPRARGVACHEPRLSLIGQSSPELQAHPTTTIALHPRHDGPTGPEKVVTTRRLYNSTVQYSTSVVEVVVFFSDRSTMVGELTVPQAERHSAGHRASTYNRPSIRFQPSTQPVLSPCEYYLLYRTFDEFCHHTESFLFCSVNIYM